MKIWFATALCLLSINLAWAGPYDPIVSGSWAGETVPGQSTVTLQMTITTVKKVKLLSVKSDVAEHVEIHSVALRKGKMAPHVVSSLALPEHRTIAFGSRNLFLMMTGIKKVLNVGDQIPLTVQYSLPDGKVKTLSASAEVRKMELSYKHYGPNEVYDHK